MKITKLIIPAIFIAGLFANVAYAAQTTQQNWNFKVFLDEKEIGYHNYKINVSNNQQVIISEANFNVNILYVYNYNYSHSNYEIWKNGCLYSIASVTDDDGDVFTVNGKQLPDSFTLAVLKQTDKVNTTMNDCVRSFAYWDAKLLNSAKLLNPQTGEYLDVDIKPLGKKLLNTNGKKILANGFRLTAEDIQIDVWYSDKQDWIALESDTRAGKLRYVVQ